MFSPDEFAHLTPEDLGYDLEAMKARTDPAVLAGMRAEMDQIATAVRNGDLQLAAKLQLDGDLKRLVPIYRDEPDFDGFALIAGLTAVSPKTQIALCLAEALQRLARLEAQQ